MVEDIVYDCVGIPSSLTTSLKLVKSKGTLILIWEPAIFEIYWTPISFKEINIIPSNTFGTEIVNGDKKRTIQIALGLISSGKAEVTDFITHKFLLDNYKKALEVASNKIEHN